MQHVSATTSSSAKKRNKVTYTPKQLPDDPEALVRLPTVLEALGISRTTFLNGIKNNKKFAGILLTPRCRAWKAGVVREIRANLVGGKGFC